MRTHLFLRPFHSPALENLTLTPRTSLIYRLGRLVCFSLSYVTSTRTNMRTYHVIWQGEVIWTQHSSISFMGLSICLWTFELKSDELHWIVTMAFFSALSPCAELSEWIFTLVTEADKWHLLKLWCVCLCVTFMCGNSFIKCKFLFSSLGLENIVSTSLTLYVRVCVCGMRRRTEHVCVYESCLYYSLKVFVWMKTAIVASLVW